MKFPEHKCSLTLTHNEHKDYYETVEEYLRKFETLEAPFKDTESRARAIETGEIWELQWYPETPVGFMLIAAPTLNELLAYAETIKT